MVKKYNMDKVKQYFSDFPTSTGCFETSDAFLFHKKEDAILHSKSLDDKEVKMHMASDYKEDKPQDAAADAAKDKLEADAAAEKKKADELESEKAAADAKAKLEADAAAEKKKADELESEKAAADAKAKKK
jgi:hypothetical protein